MGLPSRVPSRVPAECRRPEGGSGNPAHEVTAGGRPGLAEIEGHCGSQTTAEGSSLKALPTALTGLPRLAPRAEGGVGGSALGIGTTASPTSRPWPKGARPRDRNASHPGHRGGGLLGSVHPEAVARSQSRGGACVPFSEVTAVRHGLYHRDRGGSLRHRPFPTLTPLSALRNPCLHSQHSFPFLFPFTLFKCLTRLKCRKRRENQN